MSSGAMMSVGEAVMNGVGDAVGGLTPLSTTMEHGTGLAWLCRLYIIIVLMLGLLPLFISLIERYTRPPGSSLHISYTIAVICQFTSLLLLLGLPASYGILRHLYRVSQTFPNEITNLTGHIRQLIVIPIYNENEQTLALCLNSIAGQTWPHYNIHVMLTIEGRRHQPAIDEDWLQQYPFTIMTTIHPTDRPHEVRGAASNKKWGAQQMAQHIATILPDAPLNDFLLSYVDCDTILSERFLEYNAFQYAHAHQPANVIYVTPPLYQYRLDREAFFTWYISVMRTSGSAITMALNMMGPASVWTAPLALVLAIECGTAQFIADDLIFGQLAIFATDGRVMIRMGIPVVTPPRSGGTIMQKWSNFRDQSCRWSDSSFDAVRSVFSPHYNVPLARRLSAIARTKFIFPYANIAGFWLVYLNIMLNMDFYGDARIHCGPLPLDALLGAIAILLQLITLPLIDEAGRLFVKPDMKVQYWRTIPYLLLSVLSLFIHWVATTLSVLTLLAKGRYGSHTSYIAPQTQPIFELTNIAATKEGDEAQFHTVNSP